MIILYKYTYIVSFSLNIYIFICCSVIKCTSHIFFIDKNQKKSRMRDKRWVFFNISRINCNIKNASLNYDDILINKYA